MALGWPETAFPAGAQRTSSLVLQGQAVWLFGKLSSTGTVSYPAVSLPATWQGKLSLSPREAWISTQNITGKHSSPAFSFGAT